MRGNSGMLLSFKWYVNKYECIIAARCPVWLRWLTACEASPFLFDDRYTSLWIPIDRAVSRDATFGTGPHYFSYFLTIRRWMPRDSETKEETSLGGPLAFSKVRRRGKHPAVIVWSRLNKRRYHRTYVPLSFLDPITYAYWHTAVAFCRCVNVKTFPTFGSWWLL